MGGALAGDLRPRTGAMLLPVLGAVNPELPLAGDVVGAKSNGAGGASGGGFLVTLLQGLATALLAKASKEVRKCNGYSLYSP